MTEASDIIIYSSLWDWWWWQCNSRYEKKQQEGMFSWTKRLVRQVVQRILDTVSWPSPVTAHWVAGQQNLCQTWEWTFSAPWDKMVMKCPPQSRGKVYEQKGALQTEDWHLLSTSTEIISWPLQLLTFNGPERSSGWIRNEAFCALGKTGRTGLQIVRSFQEILWVPILASSHT